jgi:hypothetical protein
VIFYVCKYPTHRVKTGVFFEVTSGKKRIINTILPIEYKTLTGSAALSPPKITWLHCKRNSWYEITGNSVEVNYTNSLLKTIPTSAEWQKITSVDTLVTSIRENRRDVPDRSSRWLAVFMSNHYWTQRKLAPLSHIHSRSIVTATEGPGKLFIFPFVMPAINFYNWRHNSQKIQTKLLF